ncbi:ADP-ribosylation factor-like protein 15a [Salmo salar]|uniref:ADP-ribosylation factor-like protein 15a n=1 Tax=Salmo salar TaxID=8030 RepID=A0ABM3CXC9_SALSA|nr:ADP-ribosylation factor-like protein 15a [Salmo salar]
MLNGESSGLNTMLNGESSGLNTMLNGESSGLNTMLNGESSGLNTMLNGKSSGLNTMLNGESSGLNTMLNGESSGLNTMLNGESSGLNTMLNGESSCFRALCCKGPAPSRPEYDVVCIGLTGAGKSSLLALLCNEGSHGIGPTTGFSIKAVPFPNAILNVKELGGAENIKKYWSRYYQGSQGVVFVLDSASSDEELESARNELHSALQHPQLCTLPFLILANHQDKPAARTPNQVEDRTICPMYTNIQWKCGS